MKKSGTELRLARASAVVAQRVPAASADWFMEWQQGVAGAAEAFGGFRGADVYPPTGNQRDEWVVVVHFENEKSLQEWLDSDVQAQWVDKLHARFGNFELRPLSVGFDSWFPCLGDSPPPSWKVALAVLLGIYPTVMALTLISGPYTQPLGMAVGMLIGNVLGITILQWAVMPALNSLLAPWLKANSEEQRAFSIGGLFLILALLVGLALLFRQVTG